MTKKIRIIIIILTILSLIMPLNTTHAADTTVQMTPQTSTPTPGATFTVNVTVTDVTNLAVWEFQVFYLNTILNCTGATKGPFLEKNGDSSTFALLINNAYNATYGYILLGASLIGAVPGVNGSGTLATITFQAKTAGDSPLQFANDPVWNFLLDATPPPRNPIPYTAIDGTVHVTAQFHDIAVTNVTTCKDGAKPFPIVGRYCQMHINATVANQGSYTETFNVTIYASNATASIAINQTKLTLPNATFVVIQFQWNATLPYGNYTISAVADTVPGETDTADNTYVGTMVLVDIVGDLTGDYHVIGIDLNTLLVSFGAPTNPARPYNPNCDFNDDHIITGRDLNILLVHFGQHYP